MTRQSYYATDVLTLRHTNGLVCVWTTTDKHEYSILFTAVIIIFVFYSNYSMSSLCFSYTFLFLYCIVEGVWDSRISFPATAAVIVLHLTINHLESWILTWFDHQGFARWTKHRLGDSGLRDHTVKHSDALSASADVTGLRHVWWVFILPCVEIFISWGITGPRSNEIWGHLYALQQSKTSRKGDMKSSSGGTSGS